MSEVSKLLEPNNLILRTHMESVSKNCNREKVRQDLIESMEHYQGIGLSANQIGIMERVFIMYEDVNTRKILTAFNPKIIGASKEDILMDEGCLSYPGIWLKLKRPIAIKVEFEEALERTKSLFGQQMAQYGSEVTEADIESAAKNYLSKNEESRQIYEQLMQEKLLNVYKETLNLKTKEVSFDDFVKLATGNNPKKGILDSLSNLVKM